MDNLTLWAIFWCSVVILVILDLYSQRNKPGEISLRTAAMWSALWVTTALLFGLAVYVGRGFNPAMEYLTGYFIEWSLSMDNLFVFAAVFGYFAVPKAYQHRVLLWGIWGAVVMRFIFIFAGTILISRFYWLIYIFAVILIITGIKMLSPGKEEFDPERNFILRMLKKVLPISSLYDGNRFFTRANGFWQVTPLFFVLVVIEISDVVFALDSVPAIFGITNDPFIIYTSNIFAILGLRSFYFFLIGFMDKFRFIKFALAIILCLVGVKMLLAKIIHVDPALSLGIVLGILFLSVALSLIIPSKSLKKC